MTMRDRCRTASLAVAAVLSVAAWSAPALSQQGAPPPAVLVQPAELKPLADQAEFIGRAAAVDKVELRARVKGFLGPRQFNDGDIVRKDRSSS
jgi:membrane fusion protein (multidrug efflux system)